MSVTDPAIMDISYEPVDMAAVSPSVDDVALLEHTRTIDSTSAELGTFTDDTRPTYAEVTALIAQAAQVVLITLPTRFAAAAYPSVKQAITLQAAILLEYGFYREQALSGSVSGFTASYAAMMTGIQNLVGGGKGSRIDSPVVRGTMTDYDPYYALPLPKVVVDVEAEDEVAP
jgi:hypothetical protein